MCFVLHWRYFNREILLLQIRRAYAILVPHRFIVLRKMRPTIGFINLLFLFQVPAFETKGGEYLSESNAIAFYVANDELRGETDLERAQIVQWFSFAENEILPYSSAWVFPLLGLVPYNKNAVSRAKEDTERSLAVLNSHLLNNTFLVGERLSLADIIVFANLLSVYQHVLEPSVRQPFGNVNRWFNTILNQPQVLKVVKNFNLSDKAIEADPKKYAELQAKAGSDIGKAKKEQPKKEKKEKAPKKTEEKEPVEELDATELALAAEPASKDPFDEMPKGLYTPLFLSSLFR